MGGLDATRPPVNCPGAIDTAARNTVRLRLCARHGEPGHQPRILRERPLTEDTRAAVGVGRVKPLVRCAVGLIVKGAEGNSAGNLFGGGLLVVHGVKPSSGFRSASSTAL
jgi:hypothetical protein